MIINTLIIYYNKICLPQIQAIFDEKQDSPQRRKVRKEKQKYRLKD